MPDFDLECLTFNWRLPADTHLKVTPVANGFVLTEANLFLQILCAHSWLLALLQESLWIGQWTRLGYGTVYLQGKWLPT